MARPPARPGPDPLATYRAKRDFDATNEPAGTDAVAPTEGPRRFVVQRHRASRLHYDFRLELDGVLVSWAVPKGPTLDPDVRRLAVHVEDHPIEYFDFEGVIPAGEYGGGDVIVWDWGTWQPADTDPAASIAKGSLHFDLQGERLSGRFALSRSRRGPGKEQWLLVHKHDQAAVAGWDAEDLPTSVATGRTNEEVRVASDRAWTRADGAVSATEPTATWSAPTDEELVALDDLGRNGTWSLGGDEVRLTNLDKVPFPEAPGRPAVTKRHLIRYHATIAPWVLPYLEGRPLNMHRFPDGVDRPGFWDKTVPSNAPSWMSRWHRTDAGPGESDCYPVIDRPAAMAFLANHGALEYHPWTSRVDDVQRPTWAYIDIDPGPASTFDDVLVLARLFRTALEHLGVSGRPKVTGQRGIQVWIPVTPRYTFTETRTWVEQISRAVGATVPELVSWSWHKDDRGGLARLDYTQNAINRTLVAPFSARPAAGAPVSVPIEWSELDDEDLRPDRWSIHDALQRLATAGDPLRPLVGLHQDLPTLA